MDSKDDNYYHKKYLKYKNKYLNFNKNMNLEGGTVEHAFAPFISINLHDPNIQNNEDFKFFSQSLEREWVNHEKALKIYNNIIHPNVMISKYINDLKNIKDKFVEPETTKLQTERNSKQIGAIFLRDVRLRGIELERNISTLKKAMMNNYYASIIPLIEANGNKYVFTEENFTIGSMFKANSEISEITINSQPSSSVQTIMNEYSNYIKRLDHSYVNEICSPIYGYMRNYSPHILVYCEYEGDERKYIGSVLYCVNPIAKCVFFISIYKSFLNKCTTCSDTKFSKKMLDQLTLTAMVNDCTTIATACTIGIMGSLLKNNGFVTEETPGATKFGLMEKDLTPYIITK